MLDGKYHRNIYLPEQITSAIPTSLSYIRWSKHSRWKAARDGIILQSSYNDLKLIEAEISMGQIRKAVYRHTYNDWADLCFPYIFEDRFATTVWLTQIWDWHETLDESKYVRG